MLSGRGRLEPDRRPRGDGGDSPAWSRKREPLPRSRPAARDPGPRVPYAELHCHSNFSFLDGASHPEELVEEAARLGLDALALTDHDGMYGVVRFAEAAAELGVAHGLRRRALAGADRAAERRGRPGGQPPAAARPRPRGLPAAVPHDQRRAAARRGEGPPRLRPRRAGRADTAGHVLVLTGCRKGAVRQALDARRAGGGRRELPRLAELFGRENVAVELTYASAAHRHRAQRRAGRARRRRRPADGRHHGACTTPRPRGTRWPRRWPRSGPGAAWTTSTAGCPPAGTAHLRSGAEMTARFDTATPARSRGRRRSGASARSRSGWSPRTCPPFPVPPGRHRGDLAARADLRAAWPDALRQPRGVPRGRRQIDHELEIIEEQELPRLLPDRARHRRVLPRADILCQGRGSAANSAVCYALGITNVDAVSHGLLFERFLSPARDGHPTSTSTSSPAAARR